MNRRRRFYQRGSLQPAQHAQAPLIARPQAGEIPFRDWRTQIVAMFAAEFEEGFGHDDAYHMGAFIVGIGLAAAIPEKTGQWLERARDNRLAENIAGGRR